MTRSPLISTTLCTAAALGVFLIPMDMSPQAYKALAITVWMVLLWIFSPIDHSITSLAGCFLYWASGAVSFETAFSGFSQDTPWFLFGAVILASICLGIVEAFGVAPKSNISRGLFIIFTYTATIFDKMLIAGAASIVARGLIERSGGVPVYYSQWFLAYLPCDLITVAACWVTVLWLYPPEKKELSQGRAFIDLQLAKLGPLTDREKRAALLMVLTVVLWLTDFIHHVPAAMIGFGAGLAACLPGIGVIDSEEFKRIDPLPIILVGAVLSMAVVLVETKAIDVLNAAFFSRVLPLAQSVNYSALVLYWAGFFYHFFLPEPSNISTSMPLLMSFAKSNNLSPLAIGMIWTFAAGGKIFMYQSPVLIVGYSYGQFEAKDLLKVGLVLTVVESLILILLVPTLWPLIGIH